MFSQLSELKCFHPHPRIVPHVSDSVSFGHAKPPEAATCVTSRLLVRCPKPQVLEQGDQADHSVTRQSFLALAAAFQSILEGRLLFRFVLLKLMVNGVWRLLPLRRRERYEDDDDDDEEEELGWSFFPAEAEIKSKEENTGFFLVSSGSSGCLRTGSLCVFNHQESVLPTFCFAYLKSSRLNLEEGREAGSPEKEEDEDEEEEEEPLFCLVFGFGVVNPMSSMISSTEIFDEVPLIPL